jgi:ABC-type multidrug transport system fused ATPase/permease subunit
VGKTTLVNLIPRFYDVDEGSISINGYDIRDLTIKSIRQRISIVLQNVFLFHGSVRENILFGRRMPAMKNCIWQRKLPMPMSLLKNYRRDMIR